MSFISKLQSYSFTEAYEEYKKANAEHNEELNNGN